MVFYAVSNFVAVLFRSHSATILQTNLSIDDLDSASILFHRFGYFKYFSQFAFYLFYMFPLKKKSLVFQIMKKDCSQFPNFIPKRIKFSLSLERCLSGGPVFRVMASGDLNHKCWGGNSLNWKRKRNKETALYKTH